MKTYYSQEKWHAYPFNWPEFRAWKKSQEQTTAPNNDNLKAVQKVKQNV